MPGSARRPLSTNEAAEVLGVAPNTVRARVEDGTLKAHRLPAPAGRKRRGNMVIEWAGIAEAIKQLGRDPVHPDDVPDE